MYKIKEFSKIIGLDPTWIRRYATDENITLREENGYRIFDTESAFRINTVLMLHSLGFTMKEANTFDFMNTTAADFNAAIIKNTKEMEVEKRKLDQKIRNNEFITYAASHLEELSHSFKILKGSHINFVNVSEGMDLSKALEIDSDIIKKCVDNLPIVMIGWKYNCLDHTVNYGYLVFDSDCDLLNHSPLLEKDATDMYLQVVRKTNMTYIDDESMAEIQAYCDANNYSLTGDIYTNCMIVLLNDNPTYRLFYVGITQK